MFFELKFYSSSPSGRVCVAFFPLVSKDLIESCIDFVDDNLFSTFHTCEVVTNYQLEIGGDFPIERLKVDLPC